VAARRYKIRKSLAGKKRQQTVYRLTVPPDIARQIPEDQEFTVDWNEEGLIYRPAGKDDPPPPPSWARR
jgi:hypothetical protein